MAFYLVPTNDKNNEYKLYKPYFFNSEKERIQFYKAYFIEHGDKLIPNYYDTLREVIAAIFVQHHFGSHFSNVREREIVEIYNDLVLDFGLEFIKEKFPNEKMNDAFIKDVELTSEKMINDTISDFYENHAKYDESDYRKEGHSDWEISYDDETSKWDDETGGSWRNDNDFG